MSHANSGHADKATINARKPLTLGMRETLESLSRDRIALRHVEQSTKNRIRALVDRGMASYDGADHVVITAAGRSALSR
jgi:hypothetical protein